MGTDIFFKLFIAPPTLSYPFSAWAKTFQCLAQAASSCKIPRFKACVTPLHITRADAFVLYAGKDQLAYLVGFLFGILHDYASVPAPLFSMPFPAEDCISTSLAYVQGETAPAKSANSFHPQSSRELRAAAWSQISDHPPDIAAPLHATIRKRMLDSGFDGQAYHLVAGTADPVLANPMNVWRGFIRAYVENFSARHPEKIRVIEKVTSVCFPEAIKSLRENAYSPGAGSQRKLIFDLRDGQAALFRPCTSRLAALSYDSLGSSTLETTISHFWRRHASDTKISAHDIARIYEFKIGDPRREVAASLVAEMLGSRLVPFSRLTTYAGDIGSVQLMVETAAPDTQVMWNRPRYELEHDEANLLDFLMASTDRYENWELTSDGHIVLLDNTQTFGAPGKYYRLRPLRGHRWRASLLRRLDTFTKDPRMSLLHDLIGPRQVRELQKRSATARNYIASVGRDLLQSELSQGDELCMP